MEKYDLKHSSSLYGGGDQKAKILEKNYHGRISTTLRPLVNIKGSTTICNSFIN